MGKKQESNQALTKGETDVMNILWAKKEACTVRDLVNEYPDPKPAYTTVATFMTILVKKGFVAQEKQEGQGKTFFFKPLVTREQYTSQVMEEVKENFFGGSAKSLLSFFCREEKLSVEDVRELLDMVESAQQ